METTTSNKTNECQNPNCMCKQLNKDNISNMMLSFMKQLVPYDKTSLVSVFDNLTKYTNLLQTDTLSLESLEKEYNTLFDDFEKKKKDLTTRYNDRKTELNKFLVDDKKQLEDLETLFTEHMNKFTAENPDVVDLTAPRDLQVEQVYLFQESQKLKEKLAKTKSL